MQANFFINDDDRLKSLKIIDTMFLEIPESPPKTPIPQEEIPLQNFEEVLPKIRSILQKHSLNNELEIKVTFDQMDLKCRVSYLERPYSDELTKETHYLHVKRMENSSKISYLYHEYAFTGFPLEERHLLIVELNLPNQRGELECLAGEINKLFYNRLEALQTPRRAILLLRSLLIVLIYHIII